MGSTLGPLEIYQGQPLRVRTQNARSLDWPANSCRQISSIRSVSPRRALTSIVQPTVSLRRTVCETARAACRFLAQRRARAKTRILHEATPLGADRAGRGETLTAFCCHRARPCPNPWCTVDAPRSPAPSMPVRKYYSARRRRLPLDRTEQCCGVSLSTLTSRGSTDGHHPDNPRAASPNTSSSPITIACSAPPTRSWAIFFGVTRRTSQNWIAAHARSPT